MRCNDTPTLLANKYNLGTINSQVQLQTTVVLTTSTLAGATDLHIWNSGWLGIIVTTQDNCWTMVERNSC